MLCDLLADGVVIFHFTWILFLMFGGIWGRKVLWVRLVHLPALGFALVLELFDWYCPLTYLEVWLRERGGAGGGYPGAFIPHYLERIVYIGIDRKVVILLTLLLVGVNCLLYFGRKRS
jgi:Protein of Unknown function (DUF2784)